MKTVDKALSLLRHFSPELPEIGLSDLSRLSALDKAATRRFVVALQRHGFIEQETAGGPYRLGTGFIYLSHVREATVPFAKVTSPFTKALCEALGETAHGAIYASGSMTAVGICEPARATRVNLDPTERLPLHATASGIAYLAFCAPERLEMVLASSLERYTSNTITDPDHLMRRVEQTRKSGIGISESGLENDVHGLAAPVFDTTETALGSVAVAAFAPRMNAKFAQKITKELFRASLQITRGIGGKPTRDFLTLAKRVDEE